MFNRIQKVYKL